MASFILRYGLAHGDTPGSVDVYSLEEFTNGVHLEGRDDGPVPCYEAQQTVPTATNGGAAGNSTGYNNPFAPAINGYYTGPSVRLTVDIPFNRPNTRVIGGDGSFTWSLGYIPVGKTSLSTGPDWADPIRQDDDEKRATGQKTGKAGDCPKGELLIPINELEDGIWHTACRSFEYSELGNTGTIVAGVKGISHTVIRTDRCPGIGYFISPQAYYFSLPEYKYDLAFPTKSKKASVIALEKAFKRLDDFFKKQPCKKGVNIGLLAREMDKYIKQEFTKIGGAASKTPPLGFDEKKVEEYETNFGLNKPDC